MNKNLYTSITPYNQAQIQEALKWLSDKDEFIQGVKYFHPTWSSKEVLEKLNLCKSCADFQVAFIEPMIKNLIKDSIDFLEIIGLDKINKQDNHLYISNHRDIFLDSGLLQYELYHRGYRFTEISLGDNLIVNDTMERVAKLNNMFTVFRTGSKLQRLKNAKELSSYLRYAITQKKASAWIAQGNGRTKDGHDKTFPGLVNMLLMSAKTDLKSALAELNIVISSVSFEYEPCATEKAIELQTKEDTGTYKKKHLENIHSIVKGIEEHKGNVCLHFEKLDISKIHFSDNKKNTINNIVSEIDRVIYKNYKLHKTNYIAHDILFHTRSFSKFYSAEEKRTFQDFINSSNNSQLIQSRLLEMYARPLLNKQSLNQK